MRRLTWLVGAAVGVALVCWLGASLAPAAPIAIDIKEFKYRPATITVRAGATVTWINRDEEVHTVTSPEASFGSSPALEKDERFTRRFTTPGTYQYFCALHPYMKAVIVVK